MYVIPIFWLFAKLEGLFHSEDSTKTPVLSRRLGASAKMPRIHHIPEVVVMALIPVF